MWFLNTSRDFDFDSPNVSPFDGVGILNPEKNLQTN